MAIFVTSIVSQIKGHHQSQNLHISLNQQSKCIKNACILEYDYGKVLRKLDTHIPILEAWGLENDSGSFLDAFASYWDCYFALKSLGTTFSVFNFFHKNSNLVLDVWRNILISSFRVCIRLMYGMIRVENWIKKPFALMQRIFDFHGIIFQSFFMHI